MICFKNFFVNEWIFIFLHSTLQYANIHLHKFEVFALV